MAENSYVPDPRPSPLVLVPSGQSARSVQTTGVSVTGVAQRILAYNTHRRAALIQSETRTLFLSRNQTVTSSGGFGIPAGLPVLIEGADEVWAITAGLATPVSILAFLS